MRLESLEHLACPLCKGTLTLSIAQLAGSSKDAVEQGELRCGTCHKSYPIFSGIPRFLLATDSDSQTLVRTRRTYDFTWTRFGLSEIEKDWEKDSYTYAALIPPEIFE